MQGNASNRVIGCAHGRGGFVRYRETVEAQCGRVRGGLPFSRGALVHLLKNRTYVGEIPHKDKSFPGAHPAIVERELFDRVQELLRQQAAIRRDRPTKVDQAPLRGLIFNGDGRPMQPSFTRNRSGRPYRYYVVSAEQRRSNPPRADLPWQVSAVVVEEVIKTRLPRLAGLQGGAADWPLLLPMLKKVIVGADGIELELCPTAVASRSRDAAAALLPLKRRLAPDESASADGVLKVHIDVRARVRGGRTWLTDGDDRPVERGRRIDRALVRALRAGHSLLRNDEGQGPVTQSSYERRLCAIALMAPDIQRAILSGRQPAGLTLEHLVKTDVPLAWVDQRAAFGFPPI